MLRTRYMSGRHSEGGFSRRDLLKGTGAGALSFGSVGIASGNDVSDDQALRKLNQSERVQSILSELGDPELAIESLAQFAVREDGENFLGIRVETEFGELLYGENGSGDTGAMLQFTDDIAGISSAHKFGSVPPQTNAVLLGRKDEAVFRREATEREAKLVKQSLNARVGDNVMIYTGSDIDGFWIDIAPEGRKGAAKRYTVSFEGEISPKRENVETISGDRTPEIFLDDPQDAFEDCGAECSSCAAGLGSCGRCYFTCAGSPTGIGIVLCVFCVKVSCEIGTVAGCSFCIDCLQEHGHL